MYKQKNAESHLLLSVFHLINGQLIDDNSNVTIIHSKNFDGHIHRTRCMAQPYKKNHS